MLVPFKQTMSAFFSVYLQLLEEVRRIHSESISFTDSFNQIVPKVLALAEAKCPRAKQYIEAKEEALAEDLPGTSACL